MSRISAAWRRVPLLVLAAALSTSCGKASVTDASVTTAERSMLGAWALVQVNGNALPVNWGGVCGQNGQLLAASNVAISGSMTFLEKNHEYTLSLVYDHQCPGGSVIRNTTGGGGNWHAEQLTAVAISPGSGNVSGASATTSVTNGRISFSASLPSTDGAVQNVTPVVATLTFAR